MWTSNANRCVPGLCVCLTGLLYVVGVRPITAAPNDQHHEVMHRRVKRGWVWNQFFVLEEYTGSEPLYVGKLHSDMDKGEGSVRYILSGDGAGTVFTIDDNTGDIHAVQRLDREEKTHYTLRAQALDRWTGRPMEPESEFIIKIQDINDNEPKFLDGPYVASVPEMSPMGTSVIQLTASDADDPTYGNSARVVYSILQGQPYFSVEARTGIIRTALSNMDREVKDEYQVVVQAKDMGGQMGGLSGTTTVNITLTDVNDNPPRFPHRLYQMTVLETGMVGSAVGRILAEDADEGINAELSYRIIDGDRMNTFDIVTDNSNQVGIIVLKEPLDFETKDSYTLTVEGTNTHLDLRFLNFGPFRDITRVVVSVEDVDEPPQFEINFYQVEVYEDVAVGTTIQTISAQDPDAANNSIRYSIDRSTDPARFFSIDMASGALMIAKPLDREQFSWHNITVLAMEMKNPTQIGSVSVMVKVLDVNDNAPEFVKDHEAYICENAKPGQLIQMVSAVDLDNPQGDNTAWILTRRAGFKHQEQGTYYLPILIADSGLPVQSSTSTLTIRVCGCDLDGNVRSCSIEAYSLPISLSRGALIAILGCIFIMLVLVLFVLTLRRHKKNSLIVDDEENVHENIVRYDDEGGGEEDTEAFDIAALWNPREVQMSKSRRDMLPEIQSVSRYVSQSRAGGSNVNSYILAKLHDANTDPSAPPFDSLQTYAFEGNGSVAESLSSFESASTDSVLNYDYLTDWGPRFKKLADLYGGSESAEEFL
ncbi:cadherin-20-like isoform X2 [Stegostoma tigrinum]|uniref:cadherin-20-like isoform X2 n=1 Tax=Stegostoma tigrinum TaxID=3053191 RepID=UPI00287067BD|nr:cadherin-20-like isoform X2 [Stegostoma tigrinum]